MPQMELARMVILLVFISSTFYSTPVHARSHHHHHKKHPRRDGSEPPPSPSISLPPAPAPSPEPTTAGTMSSTTSSTLLHSSMQGLMRTHRILQFSMCYHLEQSETECPTTPRRSRARGTPRARKGRASSSSRKATPSRSGRPSLQGLATVNSHFRYAALQQSDLQLLPLF